MSARCRLTASRACTFVGQLRQGTAAAGGLCTEGLSEFKDRAASLPTADCAPYKVGAYEDDSSQCKPVCSTVSPFAKQGVFDFRALNSIAKVQDWIGNHGAVISRCC